MAAQPATLSLDELEKEKNSGVTADAKAVRPAVYSDSHKVPFEAYLHYAFIQRKKEDDTALSSDSGVKKVSKFWDIIMLKQKDALPADTAVVNDVQVAEKGDRGSPLSVTHDKRMEAQRAMRTATWINMFYLITTDILGPNLAPFAFSQLGYGSGALLFFFLGIAAAYTGFLLWNMYLKLDSDEFPVKTFSELAGRIFGLWARQLINILQTIQLLFNVALIVLLNSQGLAQVSKHRVCFSVLAVIWTIVGMFVGQIRSLQNYGGLAHFSIWLNLLAIFITVGAVANSPPNFVAASQQLGIDPGSVVTQAFISLPFSNQIVGVMQLVFSYGGSLIFIEFMAEMKRPFDFWKGMILAQVFIITVYLVYGAFVYRFQGQFTINPANQGISGFGLQTAANALTMVSALISAGLWGNIGLKVIYANVVQEMFHGPVMISRAGRIIWILMVLGYWALAFVITSAIPQFSNISGLVSAICIVQFTYTFPPIMYLGFTMQRDALEGDAEYTPGALASTNRVDTWHSWSRWRRGFTKQWYLNIFHVFLFLAAGALAGLGAFSSIEGIIAGFQQKGIIAGFQQKGAATSFGCTAPV